MMSSLVIALCTLCAMLPLSMAVISADGKTQVWGPAPYTYDDVTTWPQIAKAGAMGQWKLTAEAGDRETPDVWTTINCPTPVYEACEQPTLKTLGTGQIKISYTWIPTTTAGAARTSLVLLNSTDHVPETIETYMCYSDISFGIRPWRKKNKAYPSLTQNCFFWANTTVFPAVADTKAMTPAEIATLSGETIYKMDYNDMLPTTTLFFMLWVRCTDGNVCAFESTESAGKLNSTGLYYDLPYAGNYVYVEGYSGITLGLEAAAIVLAIVGPVFFLVYYWVDHLYYTKTGKPLAW